MIKSHIARSHFHGIAGGLARWIKLDLGGRYGWSSGFAVETGCIRMSMSLGSPLR
jgi:hypothetical protein